MSKILIVYASTDGQTRRIARHVADRLADAGHGVELMPAAEDDDLAIGRFDGVVLAGSVHIGSYQRALSDFAADKAALLNGMPTLFLSVSLSAAGHDSEDWVGLEKIETAFREATGWAPGQVVRVAGAYLPSQYDVFRAWAMRRMLAERDPGADPNEDKEYTDWPALDAAVGGWLAEL